MKTKTLMLCCMLCFAILIILGSCATMKSPDRMTYERFCGTWVNDDYCGEDFFLGAKWIFNPDGTFVMYPQILDTGVLGSPGYGTYVVEKRWTDAESKNWYNIKIDIAIRDFGIHYILCKLDKYNSVFEGAISNIDFPNELDRADKHTTYVVLYRF